MLIDFARVLWGSDNCLPQAEHRARMETSLLKIGAGSKERTLVFGDNAAKLLGIG